ncbi:MAG: winged helix-turn-helix transcriptional regulator [Salinibacterium sp.]|nr:winged helix-turn-helix transcriptional regulator [Salinibacterium sp.]
MGNKSVSVGAWEALFRAQVSVLRQLSAEFPSNELSLNEYDVLFNLARVPGRRLRIRDLNRTLLITQPSVSRLVDRLVSHRLVTKEHDPVDGRGTIVLLTDAGFDLFRKVAVVHATSIHRRVGSALTEDELKTLTALTDKLRLNGGRP